MVRRLVQQKHIAWLNECGGDAGSSAFAAGKLADRTVVIRQTHLLQHGFCFIFLRFLQILRQMGKHLLQYAAGLAEFRNLRQIREPDAVCTDDLTGIGFLGTGKNAQER